MADEIMTSLTGWRRAHPSFPSNGGDYFCSVSGCSLFIVQELIIPINCMEYLCVEFVYVFWSSIA